MNQLLLKNSRPILPGNEVGQDSVIVTNGKVSVAKAGEGINSARVIDLEGARLFVGFIDIHIHGAVGVDTNDATADELHKAAKFLAANGVTAWLPSLVPDSTENYRKSIEAIDELMRMQDEREPAARVLGVHYEGPFVSEKQCGALRTRYFKTFANGNEIADLPKLKTPGAIHLTTLAPEIEGGINLIKELKKQGWTVSIGHTRAEIETLFQRDARVARPFDRRVRLVAA